MGAAPNARPAGYAALDEVPDPFRAMVCLRYPRLARTYGYLPDERTV